MENIRYEQLTNIVLMPIAHVFTRIVLEGNTTKADRC